MIRSVMWIEYICVELSARGNNLTCRADRLTDDVIAQKHTYVAESEPAIDKQRVMPSRCKHSHARAVDAGEGDAGCSGSGVRRAEWRNTYITGAV